MIVKIPFQIIELESQSYHIVVDGKIASLELTFIIDTGASRTIIDKCYADKLEKIPFGAESPMATGLSAEQIPVELYNISLLMLNDVSFKDAQALTADLNPINEVYSDIAGKRIGGLIGCDFLLKNIKTIDFKGKCLKVLKK
ncbi:MAG: aspartyl protease family protein [Bacteroidales bacterium]|nr:aspartyl protease family protein [Bacteroidales bacterium]